MAKLNRTIFQGMALARLDDAKALLHAERFAASYYLAGYVVEFGLKACFAKQTLEHDFPEKSRVNRIHTHDLESLVETAALPRKSDHQADEELEKNWGIVKDWKPDETRYDPTWFTAPDAMQLKAREIIQAIEDREHGVLSWLQRYWLNTISKPVST